jgi:hypothetical protein
LVFELARGDVEAGGMKDWRVNDSGVLFVGFVGVVGEGVGRGVGSAMRVRGDRRAHLKNVRSKAESKAN